MIMTGETLYISTNSGIKKDGNNWYNAKFLDDEQDEFFVAFINERLYQSLQGLSKKTPVILTLNIVPGSKYFNVDDIEVLV